MDAITDPGIEQVTVMKSARVGYSKILNHVVGYHVHQDRANHAGSADDRGCARIFKRGDADAA